MLWCLPNKLKSLNYVKIGYRKRRSRFDSDKSFHAKSEGQDRRRTKQRYSGQHSSNTSKFDKKRVLVLHFQNILAPSVERVILVNA